MIRLQNPWGEKEWNGPWSDDSKEWEQVTESQKNSLGITVDEDGEFWMPWYSFVQYFTDISVCQLFNTKIFSTSRRYHEEVFYGEWTTNGVKSGAPDDFAGGCLNFSATFCNNPQFLLTVSQPGEIMFALTQREPNEGTKRRDPYVTIGIHVMKVENNRLHRIHQAMAPIGTSDYASARSVFLHLRDVPVGRYIAVPTTYAPREQTTFMLRIYSDHKVEPRLLTKLKFPRVRGTSPHEMAHQRNMERAKQIKQIELQERGESNASEGYRREWTELLEEQIVATQLLLCLR
ncbi:calpain large subunit, domain III [Ancylostoma ceylanicum]|uniref:Calpain large subunit, domain III n=1 Tax=Ancylostoma ceylanicum TaxID=53326 RepID=A0A0D6LWK2_9BILA|nr:calpain large subunit, domain III [Ancylostoma ceylanicum]